MLVVLVEAGTLCAPHPDDVTDGEPLGDEEVVLLAVLDELDGVGLAEVFDPSQARYPKGHPLGGKFRPMADRIKQSIEDHRAGKHGDRHPLDGYSREQLRRVAKARGIELHRGEDRDSIAVKLLDHIGGSHPGGSASGRSKPVAAKPAKPQGHSRLADAVDNHKVKAETELSGGLIAETHLVTFDNGVKAVRKRAVEQSGQNDAKGQADAELLASVVGRKFGTNAPPVYRPDDGDPDTVYMEYVAGATKAWSIMDLGVHQNSDEGRLVALVDTITGNADRHYGNWLVKDGTIVPIDNGFAFDDREWAERGGLRGGWEVPYDHFTTADFDEAERRLDDLKPEFDRLGRADWLKGAHDRLHRLRSRAAADGTAPDKLPPETP